MEQTLEQKQTIADVWNKRPLIIDTSNAVNTSVQFGCGLGNRNESRTIESVLTIRAVALLGVLLSLVVVFGVGREGCCEVVGTSGLFFGNLRASKLKELLVVFGGAHLDSLLEQPQYIGPLHSGRG